MFLPIKTGYIESFDIDDENDFLIVKSIMESIKLHYEQIRPNLFLPDDIANSSIKILLKKKIRNRSPLKQILL